jgi:hypothetical protein
MLRFTPGGEIDIFEGVNMQTSNQMALHTGPGCTMPNRVQRGMAQGNDCASSPGGCAVIDPNPNSYGKAFADAGGGLWYTQFETDGIRIWFVPVSDCMVKPSSYR